VIPDVSNDTRAGARNTTGTLSLDPGWQEVDQSEIYQVLQHDLRNPLHVAAANVSLASQDCDSERLDAAAAALERLDGLVEEMTRLAGIDDPVTAPEPVDIGAIGTACWQDLEPEPARLAMIADQTVRADRGWLARLFGNLFRNATTFGGTGVTVTVGTLDDGVGFYVEDDGPGIPSEDRERVRQQGYSTATDAAGLGLFIVARIAGAHGWDMRVTGGSRGGARFEFAGVDVVTGGE
jgi:signal transduction histidine kinase